MPGEIIVKIAPGTSEDAVKALASKGDCDLVKAIPHCPNFYLFRLKSISANAPRTPELPTDATNTAIAKLKALPEVGAADPNYMVTLAYRKQNDTPPGQLPKATSGKTRVVQPPSSNTVNPNDTLLDRMWGLRSIRMPEAWAIQAGVRPVVVGVLDSGIDVGHPDFNLPDGTSRIIEAANFTTGVLNDVQDTNGHGTHVAGTIGASTNNNEGVASPAGWTLGGVDVRFKVARAFGSALTSTLDIIVAGLGYLIDENVDVINMSLGTQADVSVFRDTVNRGLAQGITMVASMGNDASDNGTSPRYPAGYPGVIAVSSVGPDETLASYSNFGGPVAITAPGGDGPEGSNDAIWSAWPRSLASPITGYNSINGTSMATPHVAGVVALLLAAGAPRDPATIKLAIQTTAKPLDETPSFNGGNRYGAGLLDAYSALFPFVDPDFAIVQQGPKDFGATFAKLLPRFRMRAVGVSKAPTPGAVTVEIQPATIPTSVVRELVGGVDFDVPNTIPEGGVKSTPVFFDVPGPGRPQIELPPGRFRVVTKVSGTVVDSHFLEVVIQEQLAGRSMFANPFLVRQVNPTEPERTVFGTIVNFSLARFNALRLPSDFEYALFQSSVNGRRDQAASFSAVAPDGTPLVYEANNPSVSIAPVGLGYWVNLDNDVFLNSVGAEVTNPVVIRLFAGSGGWNQIGTPYTLPVAWGTVTIRFDGLNYTLEDAIEAGIISSPLIGYRNGDYVYNFFPNGVMEPFQGYWVRVFKDCTMIIAPSTSNALLAASRSTTVANNGGWKARFSASVAGDRDGQNYFGQANGATDGVDKLDVPKPPSGAGHAYVRFLTSESEGRSIAQAFDIRAAGKNTGEWTAAVSTDRTNADVTLNWDGLGNAPTRTEITLTDVTTGKTVDMRGRSAYTFRSGEAGSTRIFKITMKPSASAGPLAIRNVSVAPGRSASEAGMTVRFSTNRDADIKGVVKALNGTVVGELSGVSRAAGNGITSLRWNGRSRNGNPVPPGPYILEITARSTDGSTATYSQPVQHLR
jgi:subtilisin family serine protease